MARRIFAAAAERSAPGRRLHAGKKAWRCISAHFQPQQLIHFITARRQKQHRQRRMLRQQRRQSSKPLISGSPTSRMASAGPAAAPPPAPANRAQTPPQTFLLQHVDKRIGDAGFIFNQPDHRLLHGSSLN
jgi:hypothetical protein